MKKILLFLLSAVFILTLSSEAFAEYYQLQSSSDCRKIIVFKPGVSENKKDEIIKKHRGSKIKDMKIIYGASVLIPYEEVDNLKFETDILRVDDDNTVEISGKSTINSSEIIPWGIECIDAEKTFTIILTNIVKVGIIDTGIDTSHPDLKNNIKGGYNCIYPKKVATDDNGHGTHVAGIVAALHNNIGVVGVSPKANIYAIKSLDSSGNGYVSDVIEGLDWAVTNKMNVINMSFGTSSDNQSLHDAIIYAYDSGIVLVAAAGNDPNSPTNYPAAYSEVFSVSAIDETKNIASFSSTGKVDFTAPGVNINSTYLNSTYKTISGTSMAAPHVTGVVALLLSKPSKCDIDGNGVCTPEEVKKRLESSSMDLGSPGKDNVYGSGLINAYNSLTQ